MRNPKYMGDLISKSSRKKEHDKDHVEKITWAEVTGRLLVTKHWVASPGCAAATAKLVFTFPKLKGEWLESVFMGKNKNFRCYLTSVGGVNDVGWCRLSMWCPKTCSSATNQCNALGCRVKRSRVKSKTVSTCKYVSYTLQWNGMCRTEQAKFQLML